MVNQRLRLFTHKVYEIVASLLFTNIKIIKKNKGVSYIKKIKVVRKMKIKIHIILTVLYGLYTSSKFIDCLSNEKHINILTVMVYFGNILITFMIYKLGEMLGKWLSF